MVAERENIQVTEEKELLQQRTQGSRNEMEIVFDAVSCNESFARVAVAAFITHLNPTLEELADIKTAVSEAVTNAIIHGYENLSGYTKHGEMRPAYSIIHPGKVRLHCILENDTLSIEVSDQGKGIEDVARAMEPLFTTKPELERSGMDLPLWKPSWMSWKWRASRARAQEYICGRKCAAETGSEKRTEAWKKYQYSSESHKAEIKKREKY